MDAVTVPDDNKSNYDRKTIWAAAGIFAGFCAITFFLPAIMEAVGTDYPYLTGALIAAFLVLPFAGLWMRGRNKSKNKK